MGFASADVGWDPVLGTREEYRYISRFLHGWTTHKDLNDITVLHLSSEIIDGLTQKSGSSKSKYHLYTWDRQDRKMLLIWVEIMGLLVLHASVQWTNSFTEVIGHCCPSLGGAEWNGFFLQTDSPKREVLGRKGLAPSLRYLTEDWGKDLGVYKHLPT